MTLPGLAGDIAFWASPVLLAGAAFYLGMNYEHWRLVWFARRLFRWPTRPPRRVRRSLRHALAVTIPWQYHTAEPSIFVRHHLGVSPEDAEAMALLGGREVWDAVRAGDA